MMKIDRNNYETFFIEYLDGNFPLGEIDLLLDFLSENPDLAEELKGLEKIKVQPASHFQTDFDHLKKSDFDLPEIFEETCIRAVENDLSPSAWLEFQNYIQQHSDHKKTFELYRLTISEPDSFIIYNQKNRLLKRKKVNVFNYWYAVAAIFIFGLILFLPPDQKPTVHSEVQVAKSIETKVATPLEASKPIQTIRVVPTYKNHFILAKSEPFKEPVSEKTKTHDFIEPLLPLSQNIQIAHDIKTNMNLIPFEKPASNHGKDFSKYLSVNEFFAKKVNEIKGKEKNGFIGNLALNVLKKVTGKKFDYSKTNNGKVNKIEFNSQLVAFSIPLKT